MPVTPPVTPPVKRLIDLLGEKEKLGAGAIREALGLKDRTHVRNTYIVPALEAELIEYTIPEKPNSRLQKYRLTDCRYHYTATEYSDDTDPVFDSR